MRIFRLTLLGWVFFRTASDLGHPVCYIEHPLPWSGSCYSKFPWMYTPYQFLPSVTEEARDCVAGSRLFVLCHVLAPLPRFSSLLMV